MLLTKHQAQSLERHPYVIALLITILLLAWLASGFFKNDRSTITPIQKTSLAQVQIQTIHAQDIENIITLYGRAEPDRSVILQAQLKGTITQVFAERGSYVHKDDVIATIALNDLPAKLEHIKTLLKQRRLDYYGAKELFKKNYQGESSLAKRLADVTDAKAELALIENDITNATIKAPFTGILNERYVEVGDYVEVGEDVAMIADLDPLIIRTHITEHQVGKIKEKQSANIRLLNNKELKGTVRYVASIANDKTNTFKVEIAIENPAYQYLAGLSAQVDLPFAKVSAIQVSPALLSLDEFGNIGIKSVVDDYVVFSPINIVKTGEAGVWLTGVNSVNDIITLGQGFVRAGDKVTSIRMEP